jgi:hypothetical protein
MYSVKRSFQLSWDLATSFIPTSLSFLVHTACLLLSLTSLVHDNFFLFLQFDGWKLTIEIHPSTTLSKSRKISERDVSCQCTISNLLRAGSYTFYRLSMDLATSFLFTSPSDPVACFQSIITSVRFTQSTRMIFSPPTTRFFPSLYTSAIITRRKDTERRQQTSRCILAATAMTVSRISRSRRSASFSLFLLSQIDGHWWNSWIDRDDEC